MANELRFVDGDLLFDGGSLAMDADCCCGGVIYDCGEWSNGTIRSGLSFNAEVDNLTIGTNDCANCGTISLSRILAYNASGSCSGFPGSWCHTHTTSCNGCSGVCWATMWVDATCFGDTLSLVGNLSLCSAADCSTKAWHLIWRGTATASTFASGDEVTLSYDSAPFFGGLCLPTSYLTSSMRVSFSV